MAQSTFSSEGLAMRLSQLHVFCAGKVLGILARQVQFEARAESLAQAVRPDQTLSSSNLVAFPDRITLPYQALLKAGAALEGPVAQSAPSFVLNYTPAGRVLQVSPSYTPPAYTLTRVAPASP